MPLLIKDIDKISREKSRDVLYVHFDKEVFPETHKEEIPSRFLSFLEDIDVEVYPCMPFYEGFWIFEGGCIDHYYIDVPYDENHEKYILVRDFLENPDGSMRFDGITFYLLPLEMAMENKHKDDESFYENL